MFKGWHKDLVLNILDACESYPNSGISRLVNKSLITVDQHDIFSMPDLIQQMGKEIVRRESPQILRKRNRLWHYKDAHEILTKNKV